MTIITALSTLIMINNNNNNNNVTIYEWFANSIIGDHNISNNSIINNCLDDDNYNLK